MFRIIGPRARDEARVQLARLFRLREVIVSAAKPGAYPRLLPEAGRDRFDTEETVYVLAGEGGVLQGCARLNPTTSPHMLGELLAPLCDLQPMPSGPGIWECSRFVVDTASVSGSVEEFELRYRLGLGITAWCLDADVRQIVWLLHQSVFSRVSEIFRTAALGRPLTLQGGGVWIPAVSQVDLQALDRLIGRLRLAPEIVPGLLAAGLDRSGWYVA